VQAKALDVTVMTGRRHGFVQPLTFAAGGYGHKVITGLWGNGTLEPTVDSALSTVPKRRPPTSSSFAPATADLLARLAHGLDNDFLTTLYLATRHRSWCAAMNAEMGRIPRCRPLNLRIRQIAPFASSRPASSDLPAEMIGPGRLAR